MLVKLGNVNALVVEITGEERQWLADYLTFEPKQVRYTPGLRATHLFHPQTMTFPAGLVSTVRKGAERDGFEFNVIDRRVPPGFPDAGADLAWLRDYQRKALDAAVAAQRGIVRIPTGGGKTEVMIGLTRAVPIRWLALVHRTILAEQMARRYELRTPGIRAGRFFDGMADRGDGAFIASTFQTIKSGTEKGDPDVLALLEEAQGLIVDEAHTLPAWSFYRVCKSVGNAYYRIGFSGTPLSRGDERNIMTIASIGPIVYRIKTQTLVDAGVLAKPIVKMVPCRQNKIVAKTWAGVYKEGVVNSKVRNEAIVRAAVMSEKPALVFVKHTDHGRKIENALLKAGIPAAFVWGTHSTEARMRKLRDLVAGRTEVLVCSVIFQEGVDAKELRSIIIGSGEQAVISTIQRVGRGTRVDKGKTEFYVYDIADKGQRWLQQHAKARALAYAQEGYEVSEEAE